MWRASRRNSKKIDNAKNYSFQFLPLLTIILCLLWERKVHPLAIFFLFFIFLSFVARSFLSFASLSVNFSDKSLDLPHTYVQYTQREKNWELSNKAEWELFGGWKILRRNKIVHKEKINTLNRQTKILYSTKSFSFILVENFL